MTNREIREFVSVYINGVCVAGLCIVLFLLTDLLTNGFRTPVLLSQEQKGPLATITCPAGSIQVDPSQDLAALVGQSAAGTAFCLKAGTHNARSIWAKSGNSFTGEYGAIVDGANAADNGIFNGQCGAAGACDNVTIRNLEIRNHPLKSCLFFYQNADNWIVDHNKISGCEYGTNFGYNHGARVTNNIIFNNVGTPEHNGGYGVNKATDLRFENNEFYGNGRTQKIVESSVIAWVNNYSHDEANPTWMDGDNLDVLIQGNVYRNIAETAIFHEISGRAQILDNDIDGADQNGIFISTSQETEVARNKIKNAWRGINLFVACDRRVPEYQGAAIPYHDLTNNNVHDNIVTVGTLKAAPYASSLGYSNCTTTDLAEYTNNAKNNVFQSNQYTVPDPLAAYWVWGGVMKTFQQWQAIPQDSLGTLNGTAPPPPPPPSGDTVAPTVSITEPATGSSFPRRSRITIAANASDDVGVVRVEFFNGTTRINTDTTAPYSIVWNSPNQRRTYTLTAKAYDAAGNTATSAPVSVTLR